MSATNPRPNPYVGPRAFRTGEKLYGRDKESRELLDLLIAERVVLLHSPSGAGKSSLIQAGLIPQLQAAGFRVLPVMRVNQEPPSEIRQISSRIPYFNRYVFSALLSLEECLPQEEQLPLEELAGLSLDGFLSQQSALPGDDPEGQAISEVLLFDQFEEILTLNPTDRAGKEVFFAQLGAALRDRRRWVLFAMREDYYAALEPYLRPIPTRFANTFRLDLLGPQAALQAVQQPARESGVDFPEPVAQQLVDDLRRVLLQHPDGSTEEQLGLYIEPVQLQVVCYRLWRNLPLEASAITSEHLATVGDVDQSLAEYYAERVARIAVETGVTERSIREWVERQLITEGGFRGQVLMGEGLSAGLPNEVIQKLQDAHLVRGEKRRGATWFELVHDRMISPVRANNADWAQANLNTLQRQATLWEQQDRSDTLYLRDDALLEAEQWAAAHPEQVSPIDREFLDACLEVRAREEAARQAAERERQLKLEAAEQLAEAERQRAEEQAKAATRLRRRAIYLTIVLLLAVVMAGFALYSQRLASANAAEANKQAGTATNALGLSQVRGTQAIDNLGTAQAASTQANDERGRAENALTTAQAAGTEAVNQQMLAETSAAIAEQNEAEALRQAQLARSRELSALALSQLDAQPSLGMLLGVEAVRQSRTGQALDALLSGLQGNLTRNSENFELPILPQEIAIYDVALSPDGRRLAWGGGDGLIRMWDLDEQVESWMGFTSQGATVNTLDFSPDGVFLASGDALGEILLWDSQSGEKVRNFPSNLSQVLDLKFSPDGKTLAYSGVNQGGQPNIWIKEIETGSTRNLRTRDQAFDVYSVAWSPDGRLIATGGVDRVLRIWDVSSGSAVLEIEDVYRGPIRDLAFSPNGEWLATGAEDNEGAKKEMALILWDTAVWQDEPPVILPGTGSDVTSLAFSPDGQFLATGANDGSSALWDVRRRELYEMLPGPFSTVTGLAFAQFGENLLLASGSLDRSLLVSNLKAQESLGETLLEGLGEVAELVPSGDSSFWLLRNQAGDLTLSEVDGMNGSETDLSEGNPALDENARLVKLSPDRTKLAVVDGEGGATIWDLVTRQEVALDIPSAMIEVFAEGGETPLETIEQPVQIDSLSFDPVGEVLAAGVCDRIRRTEIANVVAQRLPFSDLCLRNSIYLWEVGSGELLGDPIVTGQTSGILSLAFSPQDSDLLAVGFGGATIELWDTAQGVPKGIPWIGQGGPISSLAFSADGEMLASGSTNNLIALWIVSPPQQIGGPLTGSDGAVTGLAFSPDGSVLVSGSDRGTLTRWDLNAWIDQACLFSGRNLNGLEWELFFPGEDYRLSCDDYPARDIGSLQTPTPTP